MELMQTLDDAWNSQDLGTFNQRHKPEVVVRWPGRAPTHGRHDHKAKAPRPHDPSRPAPRQPALQSVLRLRRPDLLNRPLLGHHDRPMRLAI